jgi:hypothetical protein
MAAWRTLGSLLIAMFLAGAGRAQPYVLTETVQARDCFRIHIDMALAGEMRVAREGKVVPIKLTATASHVFPERILKVAATGLPEKSARFYEIAKADILAGNDRSERSLRAERRLFVAQRAKDQPLTYSPAGPLSREEMELTSEHFDTLALTGLLPVKPVAVGDTWTVPNSVAQALCGYEGLTEQTLACKLEAVSENTARIAVAGTANGIELGALVKTTITATARFDLQAHRLAGLTWKQKDERDQGPASPASTTESTTTLSRTPADTPETLSDVKLVSIPDSFEPPMAMTQLVHRDPKSRYDLMYARVWQVVGQTDAHLIMRLMERGEFVAQVTITPWTPAEKGKHLSPEEFRDAMNGTPSWEATKELQAGEVPAESGRWIYRISALGTMDGLDVMQNFYLVAGPSGEQAVLAFTLAPKQADRLGTRDLSLVGSLEFPPVEKRN